MACLTVLIVLLCFSGAGLAHRVNISAYADGDAIQVECYFSGSKKVRRGKLVFTDLETGATLLEETTDEHGMFRFRPGADFLQTGHGLNIRLIAGEGHQKDWQISPEELGTLSASEQPVKLANEQAASTELPHVPSANQTELAPSMDAAELEALVGRVLDEKLAPIKQTLARQEDRGPAVKDIIGGIGWILGLLGLATYIKYKR